MAYAGLRMLMDNLKKLIHGNHDPLINNNPMILSESPQFQLLYQELASVVQTLFSIHHLHEIQRVINLKRRFKDATKEAQDIIVLFLSGVHFRDRDGQFPPIIDFFKTSLDLEKVLKSIKSIKVELMTINIGNMKMDSSSRIDHIKPHSIVAAAGTSFTTDPLGTKKPSEEIVVGLDHDVDIIRDKLTEDTKQLGVVSIVGMGGLGKTTLATKVFNDGFIVYHFRIRAWVTVSQTYRKRDLLIQILASIGVEQDLEIDNDSKLREKLHKNLMGRRYLIVIDDIWSIEAWDELKLFFPHENTRSRILLTTRLNEVALHVKPHGFVHSLPYLAEEESWKLLREKVFHGNGCPEWLIKPGMQIAKKCEGLPLSVVVVAGVLEKETMTIDLWEKIACSIGSYIVKEDKGNLETLALSYHHLPHHLRECFLYLGGFAEDFTFVVEMLIWLWVAEGFIEEVENQSLEDTAKAYLMDLINRNLVIVAKRNSIGDVKACKLHDLVRELCVQKAKEESFFLEINSPHQRHLFTNEDVRIGDYTDFPTPTIRSVLCFDKGRHMHPILSIEHCLVLVRVLDLQECQPKNFPEGFALLIHLRYLAIWYSKVFPNSICKLWSLQTLILKSTYTSDTIQLPCNITDLVNLRHLWSNRRIYFPNIGKPMNLKSISTAVFRKGVDNVQKCFPNIKKLALSCGKDDKYNFELLPYLEILKVMGPGLRNNDFWLPATLKKLTLLCCLLPWSDMSIIQSLPNLEVLRLKANAFMGRQWDASEQQFPQLKLLTLERLWFTDWEASSTSFPCLKRLALRECKLLEEIPLEIGEIATLELIETDSNSNSVVESVKRIQQERDMGNNELKITIDGVELSFYLSQPEDSESEREYAEFISSSK